MRANLFQFCALPLFACASACHPGPQSSIQFDPAEAEPVIQAIDSFIAAHGRPPNVDEFDRLIEAKGIHPPSYGKRRKWEYSPQRHDDGKVDARNIYNLLVRQEERGYPGYYYDSLGKKWGFDG